MYCQVFTSGEKYHITRATRTDIWSQEWHKNRLEFYNPVLMSCQVPSDLKPIKLSLNVKPCEHNRKNFNIRQPVDAPLASYHGDKKLITICVKPLSFDQDISEHLIQWIEINKVLGAGKIDIYVRKVHPNVWKVLNWYKNIENGAVDVVVHKNVEDELGKIGRYDGEDDVEASQFEGTM